MFNVRVYGLLIHDGKILLSDETYEGHQFTKFPGGGLQFGESTIDCLKREMLEEYNWEIDIVEHFYTTDFFVKSVFNAKSQVIAIYYRITLKNKALLNIDNFSAIDQSGSMRWKNLNELKIDDVTFPIEKKVVALLKSKTSL